MLGVLGDGPVTESVHKVVAEDDAPVVSGAVEEVLSADPDLVVAVGEAAVVSLAGAGAPAPVLPVAAGRGLRSVPADDAPAAVERAVAGDWTAEERPVLTVDLDGRELPALLDALLVTAEPASISEYGIAAGDGEAVGRFRADGVVVATPAGSLGYARSAGGPVVGPAAGSVVAVPVAPFTTDRPTWVLDLPVSLTVERESTDVSIVVDGTDRGTVPPDASVTVRPGGTLTLATVPESLPFFADRRV